MSDPLSLPDRLRAIRGADSREKMAERLTAAGFECSGPRLYDWESGRTRIPAEVLPVYAVVGGLSVDEQLALAGMPAADLPTATPKAA